MGLFAALSQAGKDRRRWLTGSIATSSPKSKARFPCPSGMALLVCSLREGVGLAANVAFIVPECGACRFALSTRNRMADGPESAHGREGGRDARADRRWLTRVGSAAGAGLSSDGGEKVRGLGLRPSARPTAATTNTGPGAALRPRVRESAADLSDRAGRLLRPAAHGAVAVGPSRTSPARMAAAPASGVEKKAGAGPSRACRSRGAGTERSPPLRGVGRIRGRAVRRRSRYIAR